MVVESSVDWDVCRSSVFVSFAVFPIGVVFEFDSHRNGVTNWNRDLAETGRVPARP